MSGAGTMRGTDRFFGFLCRRILSIYFREIEVVGERFLPGGVGREDRGPLLAVANHVNGLIDPLFVMGTLRLPARMLGKSTLWKIPVLSQLLDLAGVIPVYRRQDEGADPAKNLETFARCHEELARGGAIAIFPEGISHDRPNLQPLKTGAARIVLEAESRFGPLGCRIVPIGLHFEERERLRSRALVVVGEPIDPRDEIEVYGSDPVIAVRLLTERVAEALERVTLNYASWEEARLVERGARILEIDALEMPRERSLATEFDARRDLLDGLGWLRARHPAAVEEAADAARAYDRLLSAAGLRDEQVVASYPVERIAGYLARKIALAALAVVPAFAGTVLFLVPYSVVAQIAWRVRHEPNQVATYKVFPGIAIYPVWWLLLGIAAWRLFGGGAAVVTLLVSPLLALVAVRFHERLERFWSEARAFLLLKGKRSLAEELKRRRLAADERIDRLVQLWVESQAYEPSSR